MSINIPKKIILIYRNQYAKDNAKQVSEYKFPVSDKLTDSLECVGKKKFFSKNRKSNQENIGFGIFLGVMVSVYLLCLFKYSPIVQMRYRGAQMSG
jgi:hypothetical protein